MASEYRQNSPFPASIFLRLPLFPGEDNFTLLQNGSLLYFDEMLLLSQEKFCVETIEDIQETVPLICAASTQIPEVVYYIYSSGKSQ